MEGATGANASGDKTPPFLKKLLELLKSEEFRDFIDWTGRKSSPYALSMWSSTELPCFVSDDGRNIIVRKVW